MGNRAAQFVDAVIKKVRARESELQDFMSGAVFDTARDVLTIAKKYRSAEGKTAMDNPETIEVDMVRMAASLPRINTLLAEYEYYRNQISDELSRISATVSQEVRERFFTGAIKAKGDRPPSEAVIQCHIDAEPEVVKLTRAKTSADAVVSAMKGVYYATNELVQVLKRRQDSFRQERRLA